MKNSNNKGFSLVELMIAVVIIGVLAAIAIPQYQQYIRKARVSEARNTLGAMYTAEKTYVGEFGSATSSLQAMGYGPEGSILYNCGWADSNGAKNANDPTTYTAETQSNTRQRCTALGVAVCRPINSFGGAPTTPGGAAPTNAQFTIQCNGWVGGTTEDQWTINQAQLLTNPQSGIL